MGVDLDGNGIGEPVDEWELPIPSDKSFLPQTDDDFSGPLGLQWQWNHNPVDTHWNFSDREGWLTLRALPADSLKACRNMLTQKVIGYQSESTTLVDATGDCFAGLFCSGKLFRGIGLTKEGICIEAGGERQLIVKGRFQKVWLRVTNDNEQNLHQFLYSLDGEHFLSAGEVFPMRGGYWKGIRTGLFCYGPDGQAQFDLFQQKVAK